MTFPKVLVFDCRDVCRDVACLIAYYLDPSLGNDDNICEHLCTSVQFFDPLH